mmetsp:Transcript_11242/g.26867  ORF Transcript_11242/g.26867 Transcript_11242/m.26867 type:complete len:239 (+) Transcript_11242:950-1666(+)
MIALRLETMLEMLGEALKQFQYLLPAIVRRNISTSQNRIERVDELVLGIWIQRCGHNLAANNLDSLRELDRIQQERMHPLQSSQSNNMLRLLLHSKPHPAATPRLPHFTLPLFLFLNVVPRMLRNLDSVTWEADFFDCLIWRARIQGAILDDLATLAAEGAVKFSLLARSPQQLKLPGLHLIALNRLPRRIHCCETLFVSSRFVLLFQLLGLLTHFLQLCIPGNTKHLVRIHAQSKTA